MKILIGRNNFFLFRKNIYAVAVNKCIGDLKILWLIAQVGDKQS